MKNIRKREWPLSSATPFFYSTCRSALAWRCRPSDALLVELKQELAVLESKRLKLEIAGAKKKIEIGCLIDQAVELAGDFKSAFSEGTIEEKRLFLRAFLKGIELDPIVGKGQAKFILLPGADKIVEPIRAYGQRINLLLAK